MYIRWCAATGAGTDGATTSIEPAAAASDRSRMAEQWISVIIRASHQLHPPCPSSTSFSSSSSSFFFLPLTPAHLLHSLLPPIPQYPSLPPRPLSTISFSSALPSHTLPSTLPILYLVLFPYHFFAPPPSTSISVFLPGQFIFSYYIPFSPPIMLFKFFQLFPVSFNLLLLYPLFPTIPLLNFTLYPLLSSNYFLYLLLLRSLLSSGLLFSFIISC